MLYALCSTHHVLRFTSGLLAFTFHTSRVCALLPLEWARPPGPQLSGSQTCSAVQSAVLVFILVLIFVLILVWKRS